MKLKKITLENFRKYESIEIEFPNSNHVVLIGNNSSGKSTILDAIGLCFAHVVGQLFSRDEKYAVESMIQVDDIRIGSKNASCELEFDWPTIPMSIQISRKIEQNGTSFNLEPKNLLKRIKESIQDDNNYQLPVFTYYRANRTNINYYLGEGLKPTYDQRLWSYSRSFSNSRSSFIDFESWYCAVHIELEKDPDYKHNLKYVDKAILTFLTSFHKELASEIRVEMSNPTAKYHSDKYRIEIFKNNKWIKLRNLSSGEKSIIYQVGDIARRLSIANNYSINTLEGIGIILIDEIDLHLHPKWQREIIGSLDHTFPNLQFIFSTHSPQVLSTLKDEDIIILTNNNYTTTGLNPFGRDTNSILEELMYVNRRPFEIQIKLDKLLENLALDGDVTSNSIQLYNELRNELSESDPILSRLDLKMKMLKK